MTIRNWLIGVITVAMVAPGIATAASEQGSQGSDKTIAVIVKATNSSYWQTVFMGARAAAKDTGVQLQELGAAAETDIVEQVSIVENTTAKSPDAIVLSPTATDPLGPPVEAATEAGIPVILIDSAAATESYASFLSTDNYAGGQNAADALASCIKEQRGEAKGQISYLTAVAGAESLTSRDNGFVDRIKEAYPDLEIVDNRVGDNDIAKGMSTMLDMLNRYPDLAGVFADNNMMGNGVGAAIDEQGAKDEVCVVAFDADNQEVTYLDSGVIDALIVQDPYMMGYAGVWSALAASNGVRLAKEVDTGANVVTTENMDEPAYAGLLKPSERKLTPYLGK